MTLADSQRQAYTIHDIGSAYPNATGHDDGKAEQMPIEETGNLLILAYAYTKAVNSPAWANSHRQLLQGYADYLVTNGLNIAPQLSTDDGEGRIPNATNLAIKAAVGLTAFGATFDLQNYTNVGLSNANQLYNQSLGTDPEKTHFQRQYPQLLNANFTYSTVFNLYPDSLLGLNTFPQAAFDMQASFYPTQQAVNGVPLDSYVIVPCSPASIDDYHLLTMILEQDRPVFVCPQFLIPHHPLMPVIC